MLLEIEGYELERLEKPVTRGFTRVTTVVRLRGGGEEGLGEDVTWYAEHHDREQAAGAVLPLAGSSTLESFSDALEMEDAWRRWAYESAALDLALRQGGMTLAEAVGRDPQPVSFVISPGLGEPPTSAVVRRWLELDPAHRFKLDTASDCTGPDRRARRNRRGRHRRLQGVLRRRGRPAARHRPLPPGGGRLSR